MTETHVYRSAYCQHEQHTDCRALFGGRHCGCTCHPEPTHSPDLCKCAEDEMKALLKAMAKEKKA